MTVLILDPIRSMYKVDTTQEAERRFRAAVEDVYTDRYYVHNIVIKDISHTDYDPGHFMVDARLYVEAKDGKSNPDYTGENERIKRYDPVAAGQLSEWVWISWIEEYWVIIAIIIAIIMFIVAVVM